MAGSDAIEVVEDWISEHYFTTDARNESFQAHVLRRRKAWDEVDKGIATPLTRFAEVRRDLSVQLAAITSDDDQAPIATPTADVTALYDSLREVLGFCTGEFRVTAHDGVRRYNTTGVDADPPLAIVDAIPAATHEELFDKGVVSLLTPYVVDETTYFTSMPRLVSHLFLAEDAPEFALILAGRWALVAERARWAEGRYLAINLQTVCERNDTKRGGEADRALACLSAESLAPDADSKIWWSTILEDSVQHTVGVSKDLREGVRLSIEIIANEVVARRKLRGLPALPQEQAQPLAKQSLRFLYRILFLLYAEASPELAVLPVDAPEYEAGYSLTRLRELTLVEITSARAQTGTHLFDSLGLLFRLVDQGHSSAKISDLEGSSTDGLDFQPLRADLFAREAISLVDEVKLGNSALQQVLRHLLLSKEVRGRDRGFISYVELGINQLGAVYEGLMSYTGSFAETDLYEVARNGDSSKGSWAVPNDRAGGIAEADFVRAVDPITGESKAVVHERGSFVFRLSGRERQQSASYYTPEVLTRFTVGQALEELLDQGGRTTTAEEILGLTICEPALGSGAFAIEAVRQLAGQYLTRRQAELGEAIPPEEYPQELQRVKASIALHQVYGVDLNATAVEFAEIALWLDSMAAGLQAPWFGLHLRRGNSLIGARRAVYTRDQVGSKQWLESPPTEVPLTDIAERVAADDPRQTDAGGRVPHWLLPAKGWGATSDSKEAKDLAPERTKLVKDWRRSIIGKPTKTQLDALVEIGYQAEELWRMAYRRLSVAEAQSRRSIPLWRLDRDQEPVTVTREEIEASLADPDGAYQRLRRVMDAWCALWFWPLTGQEMAPPTLAQWIDACQQLLGKDTKARKAAQFGAGTLAPDDVWQALADQEDLAIKGSGGKPVADVMQAHPWLRVCERTAQDQGFFHWQLDFATVFGRGGFDLQVGNPPWVRPRGDTEALLAEGDPWWTLALKASEAEKAAKRPATLSLPGVRDLVVDGSTDVVVTAEYVGFPANFPILAGLQPDLYRCFMAQTWGHASTRGVVALVHLESHFTDEKAGLLRSETYSRLRRHWQFINELKLYEIQDQKTFGINVYGSPGPVHFQSAASLYHPDTVERSLRHDGTGPEPGFKDPDGHWDQRPHAARIISVTEDTLGTWHEVLEDDSVPIRQTRMVYTVNRAVAEVLSNLARHDRVGSLKLGFSRGWDESIDRKKGFFESRWGTPPSWAEVILQGPHLFVATPLYKTPNQTMLHQQDWSATDFESLAPDAIPATAYKPAGGRARYKSSYTHWGDAGPARDHYRIAWREMAANTGERTLIAALIPPGAAHVHAVGSVGGIELRNLVIAQGFLTTLVADFSIRSSTKNHINPAALFRPPIILDHPLQPQLLLRALRLNCVTHVYGDLWREVFEACFAADSWATGNRRSNRPALGDIGPQWSASTPLRIAEDRRQALVELDALVALMLGITAEQLCTVYRTQFAVLYGYDHSTYLYDANGRLVPNSVQVPWRTKGDALPGADRTATNQAGNTYIYELPFQFLDREQDMRTAYAEFERRLAKQS